MKLLRDAWTVLSDGIYWLCRSLWRINRRLARSVLPGQARPVLATVAALAVLLEIVGLWVGVSYYLQTH